MDDDADELKKQVRTLEQINFQLTNKMANFAEKVENSFFFLLKINIMFIKFVIIKQKLALLKMTEINEMDRISLNKQFRKFKKNILRFKISV